MTALLRGSQLVGGLYLLFVVTVLTSCCIYPQTSLATSPRARSTLTASSTPRASSTHQRPPLPLLAHEVRHWYQQDPFQPLHRLPPALCILCHSNNIMSIKTVVDEEVLRMEDHLYLTFLEALRASLWHRGPTRHGPSSKVWTWCGAF